MAPVVIKLNDVAIRDSPGCRILAVEAADFTPATLATLTEITKIELTVQARRGLIGNQPEWVVGAGFCCGSRHTGWPGQLS